MSEAVAERSKRAVKGLANCESSVIRPYNTRYYQTVIPYM